MLRKKTIEFAWFARGEILQDDRRPFILLLRLRGVTKDTRNDRLLVLEERGPAGCPPCSVRVRRLPSVEAPRRELARCLDLGGDRRGSPPPIHATTVGQRPNEEGGEEGGQQTEV